MTASELEPHHVYRCYDVNGTLLYVGCSINIAKRIREHQTGGGAFNNGAWPDLVVRVEVTTYPTKAEGRAAELAAIRAEEPLYNVERYRARWLAENPGEILTPLYLRATRQQIRRQWAEHRASLERISA